MRARLMRCRVSGGGISRKASSDRSAPSTTAGTRALLHRGGAIVGPARPRSALAPPPRRSVRRRPSLIRMEPRDDEPFRRNRVVEPGARKRPDGRVWRGSPEPHGSGRDSRRGETLCRRAAAGGAGGAAPVGAAAGVPRRLQCRRPTSPASSHAPVVPESFAAAPAPQARRPSSRFACTGTVVRLAGGAGAARAGAGALRRAVGAAGRQRSRADRHRGGEAGGRVRRRAAGAGGADAGGAAAPARRAGAAARAARLAVRFPARGRRGADAHQRGRAPARHDRRRSPDAAGRRPHARPAQRRTAVHHAPDRHHQAGRHDGRAGAAAERTALDQRQAVGRGLDRRRARRRHADRHAHADDRPARGRAASSRARRAPGAGRRSRSRSLRG